MASNKTILKAIERCDNRIERAKAKAKYSSRKEDREAAKEAIEEQESKIIRLRQQIIFNNFKRE
tara:strand:- start:218 stop:409 length:192 start_codon:yes stop_codon:yes gene_type:complete